MIGRPITEAPGPAYRNWVVTLLAVCYMLNFIDRDKTFSHATAASLRRIRFCAFVIGASFFVGIVTLRILSAGTDEDSAGPTAIAMLILFFCLIVTAVSTVLEKQVQKAIDLKSESLP